MSNELSEYITQIRNSINFNKLEDEFGDWVVKITLKVKERSKNNYFPEGISGTSMNNIKKRSDRQRVVLMAKLDFSGKIPVKISPLSGMLCYKTIIFPHKIEYCNSPDTHTPCFNLVTEIHSGVNREGQSDGFVGVTIETWRFAVKEHLLKICSTNLHNKNIEIRDANGVPFIAKNSSDIKKMFNVHLKEEYVLDKANKYPIHVRTDINNKYVNYLWAQYNIRPHNIKMENNKIRGLFYLEATNYLQYSCDNDVGIQMFPESTPNSDLEEYIYGHKKYSDVSLLERKKIRYSRSLFYNICNTLVNPDYLNHFSQFYHIQQNIVRILACIYDGYCCYMNDTYDRKESNIKHVQKCYLGENCCRTRYCVNKPDKYTQLLEQWVHIGNKAIAIDSTLANIGKIFSNKTTQLDDVLTEIINQLSEFVDKNLILNILDKSRSPNQNLFELLKTFNDLMIHVFSINILKSEFKKFRLINQKVMIDNKLIEREFWDKWEQWLEFGLQSRDYIFEVKQKHYKKIALKKSEKCFNCLSQSWDKSSKQITK